MKQLKLLTVCLVATMFALSCRDNEKEKEQVERFIISIDSVEVAIDKSAEEVEAIAEEVEMAIKELDSI